MSRRVLVTGATGFIGRHVVAALAARGDRVWALARTAPPPETSGQARGASWLSADLLDDRSTEGAVKSAAPDLVVHLAGATSGLRAELEALNVGGTRRLVAAAARAAASPGARSARVLVVGSAAEYGAVPEAALPIREDTPLAPVGDYGRSKAEASAAALADGARLGVGVVVARVFNVTGPGEPESLLFGRVAVAIARAERAAGEGGEDRGARAEGAADAAEIPVGPLGATRDLIDVRDVARALLAIADGAATGAIVNVARGVEERVRDHVARLAAHARVPVRVAEPPSAAPPAPARHAADVSMLRALGFRPAVSLDESARDLVDDARSRIE